MSKFSFTLFLTIWIFIVHNTHCDDSYDPCEHGKAGLHPHQTECQLYYNCSLPPHLYKPWLGKHVMECKYPDLFSGEGCEEFVNCGSRSNPDNACEYRNNMCQEEFCFPCRSDFTCGKGTPCDYTATMRWIRMTCPRDKNGNLKILDNALCLGLPTVRRV